MTQELLAILGIFLATMLLAIPLGRYLAATYRGDRN